MSGPATRRSRPRARKGEGDRLRDEILAAAEKLLLAAGSQDSVSIRAVANATGVTPPSIYRHFLDKSELMLEVCGRHFTDLDEKLEAAMVGLEDPLERLRARGRAYIEFGLANPAHYRIMFMDQHLHDEKLWKEITGEGPFAHLIAGVAAAIDAGELRAIGDAFETATHVWANVHGLTSLLITNPTFPWPDLDKLIDDHLDICLTGLTTGPGTKRR